MVKILTPLTSYMFISLSSIHWQNIVYANAMVPRRGEGGANGGSVSEGHGEGVAGSHRRLRGGGGCRGGERHELLCM